MTEVKLSSSFKKAYKKKIEKNKKLSEKFTQKFLMFSYNPFDPILKTHKLTGRLNGLWSFSVDYDLRVIFYFSKDNSATFLDVGTHTELY